MAQSKVNITPDNMAEWLASTGFLFPRNEMEMSRFDKLYPDESEDVSDFQVDCAGIFSRTLKTSSTIPLKKEAEEKDILPLKMVARKGSDVPKHILDKMKKNQDGRAKNDTGTTEKGIE
ncbi:hypothetical protein [Olivibacter domesticus]|uniref:Uncharacterized protein n=1 Tax=Olivibacter domesticus TaxID=407022 RepID=A0A1H7JP12_OLID1|nr:hypothetical protein [Olivibacter domesticus]SEK76373.1 hypothetical protein SAMN05661044_01084 [Olivibacter domesticus]